MTVSLIARVSIGCAARAPELAARDELLGVALNGLAPAILVEVLSIQGHGPGRCPWNCVEEAKPRNLRISAHSRASRGLRRKSLPRCVLVGWASFNTMI